MGTRENKIETYLNNEVKRIGGITRKWTCPGRRGVPDRIVMFKGTVWFVEVKTSDGELSISQIREQTVLIQNGVRVRTVYNKTEINKFISCLKNLDLLVYDPI